MRSAGQSVQKYIHATVGPERVYTPKQNFNVRPCLHCQLNKKISPIYNAILNLK